MHTTTISINEYGDVLAVYHPAQEQESDPASLAGVTQEQRRGARVWPVNPAIRLAFKLLRRLFGDEGRVSEWTRAWGCSWALWDAVTLERLSGEYATHNDAVCAEIAWIVSMF